MSRAVTVSSTATPPLLGAAGLEFKALQGQECLSEPYAYHVTLITPDNPLLTALASANVVCHGVPEHR